MLFAYDRVYLQKVSTDSSFALGTSHIRTSASRPDHLNYIFVLPFCPRRTNTGQYSHRSTAASFRCAFRNSLLTSHTVIRGCSVACCNSVVVTNHLSNNLTHWSTNLFEKLTIFCLVKKLSVFHSIRIFIAVCTTARLVFPS
jgi:hypothetical protein